MEDFTTTDRLIFSAKISLFSPFVYFVEEYIFNDWNMLISVLALLFVDAAAMMLRAIMDKDYTIPEGIKSFSLKTMAVALTLLGLSIIDLATVKGLQMEALGIINTGFYTAMFGFLGISILTHAYSIFPIEPIRLLLVKLKQLFESDGTDKNSKPS
jgi:hypothetical protein